MRTMGCSQSYPLPAGKFDPHHPRYAPNFPIPNQIDVKRGAVNDAKEALARSPKLSPLRELISAQEVARPQSEETKLIRERLTTEMLTSVTSESLSVIKEDDVENVPKSFEVHSLGDDSVDEGQKQKVNEKKYRVELNESTLIEVLAIESKIDQIESCLLNTNSSMKRNDTKVQLMKDSMKDNSPEIKPKMALRNSNKFQDRVTLLALICLLFIYLSALSLVGWMGFQAFQSLRYFIAPTPRLNLRDYNIGTKMLVNDVNDTILLSDEIAENAISTNSKAFPDTITLSPYPNYQSKRLGLKSKLSSVAIGVSKGAGHGLMLTLDADAKKKLRDTSKRMAVHLKQQSASMVSNLERKTTTFKEKVRHSQTLSTVIITLKEASDFVDSGYYFI